MDHHWNQDLYSPAYDVSSPYDSGYWTRPTNEVSERLALLGAVIRSVHVLTTLQRLQELVKDLQELTRQLATRPHDCTIWRDRSRVLEDLGYPELSVMDAEKALLLRQHGHTLGFATYSIGATTNTTILGTTNNTPPAALDSTEIGIRERLISALRAVKSFSDAWDLGNEASIRYQALMMSWSWWGEQSCVLQALLSSKLAEKDNIHVGRVHTRAYPWMEESILKRPQLLIELLASGLEQHSLENAH